MTPHPAGGPSETLDELLAEIRRYEGYLDKLEERRAGTPEHLVVRLRDEYETRLADLRVRAEVEADALAAGLEEDEAAVREVEARLAEVEEERAEGELRAAVGELDPRVWAKRLNGLNAQIASITAERDALVAALAHRRNLLEEVLGDPASVDEGMTPSDRPPRVSFASPAVGGDILLPPTEESPSVARFERPSAPAPRPSVSVPPVPPAGTAVAGTPGAVTVGGEGASLFDELGAFAMAGAARGVPPREEPVRGATDAKSLKCHECGTLNFPSEWYCERCGGELEAG